MSSKQTNTVAACEATLAGLEKKREACVRRGTELQDERANVALAAHTGDAAARKRLDAINRESAEHASELQSLDAALRAAAERVAVARRAEAEEQDRANAAQVRKVLGEFVECGHELDDALNDVAQLGYAMIELLSKLHGLGVSFPSHEQLSVLGWQCVLTSLMASPWRKRTDHLPPNQRRSFKMLVDGWAGTVNSGLVQRLDEQSKESTDAAA
jgi:molecular chaperone GrpE (heat shock protein)